MSLQFPQLILRPVARCLPPLGASVNIEMQRERGSRARVLLKEHEQPTGGGRIFANHIADQVWYSEYIKNSDNLKIKRQITQFKNGKRI